MSRSLARWLLVGGFALTPATAVSQPEACDLGSRAVALGERVQGFVNSWLGAEWTSAGLSQHLSGVPADLALVPAEAMPAEEYFELFPGGFESPRRREVEGAEIERRVAAYFGELRDVLVSGGGFAQSEPRLESAETLVMNELSEIWQAIGVSPQLLPGSEDSRDAYYYCFTDYDSVSWTGTGTTGYRSILPDLVRGGLDVAVVIMVFRGRPHPQADPDEARPNLPMLTLWSWEQGTWKLFGFQTIPTR